MMCLSVYWVRLRRNGQIPWSESQTTQPGAQADEMLCKQLGEISQLLVLVLVGSFSLPDVCWKSHTAESKQSRPFLEHVRDNLLTLLMRETTREDTAASVVCEQRTGW